MRGESAATIPSTRRLPVNQRRHRVAPENRKRVTTACNNCNIRRIRCSGQQPCLQCDKASRDCQYPAAVEKVSLPRSQLDELKSECSTLAKCLELLVPDGAQRQHLIARVSAGLPVDIANPGELVAPGDDQGSGDSPTPSSDGRTLSDHEDTARDPEPTPGSTFLGLVDEFMATIITLVWPESASAPASFSESLGRYRSLDSRPLGLSYNVEPTWLPGRTEIKAMLTQLSYFAQDGNGEYPSGGLFYWGDLDPSWVESSELSSFPHEAPTLRRLALYQAALAMACLLRSPAHPANTAQRGEAFFARAKILLGNPLDAAGSAAAAADLSVWALAALYSMELNRRDAAYMYAGVGMRIAVTHGVHQGRAGGERTKRAFWTLYVVDRWLSVVTVRPTAIADDDVQLPLPQETQGLPPAHGLTAHVELARIAGSILWGTLRMAPTGQHVPVASARTYESLDLLADWLAKLPPELRLDDRRASQDNACCELHMGYNQLTILALRPLFFASLKKAVAERYSTSRDNDSRQRKPSHSPLPPPATGEHIEQCLTAARHNMRLGRQVRDPAAPRKLLVPVLHHLFHAAVVLLLYQLVTATPDGSDAADVAFAVDCFDAEARGGGDGGHYPRDCVRVLREIRGLVLRLRARGAALTSPAITTAYDVGFILSPEASSMSGVIGPQSIMTDALHDDLSAWLSYDDLQLFENQSTT